MNIIIETHSEHIIRKFQLLVAKGELSNDEIAIIYIEPESEGMESNIKSLDMNDIGNFINPWPSGFFDEASDLAYALIEAQANRQN